MTTATPPSASPPSPGPEPLRLTARSPDDLIAMGTLVLGFTPSDSVVMLTFGGDHAFHARIDLPDAPPGGAVPTNDPEWASLADALLDPAAREHVTGVVLLVYSESARAGRAAWRALTSGCARRGIDVLEALRVAPSRWHPLRPGRDRELREVGVPYDVAAHPFLVQSVVSGRVTHATREDLVATVAADPVRVAAVEAVLAAAPGRWPERPDTLQVLAEGAWARRLVTEHVAAGTTPSDADAARLLGALASVRVRDAVWSLISRVDGAVGHVALWTDLLRRCPPSSVPPAAALLAWAAWQSGDGALAWCALDRCTEVDPGYRLADLLAQLLTRAVPPSEWDSLGEWDWREGLTGS